MAAPYPRRGPQQGVARAVNRGSKGMAQGRFAGLGTVRADSDRGRTEPPEPGTLVDYGYMRIDSGTANGSTLPTSNPLVGSAVTDTLTNGASASYNTSTGIFTADQAGLWVLSGYVVVTSPVTGASIIVSTQRVATAEASPVAFFHADSFAGANKFTAASCSPPTPQTAGASMYVLYYAPSSGAVLSQFYLVLYPIALF